MKKVTKKEAEEWDKKFSSGKATLNEIRERYGLSRIEGGDVRLTIVQPCKKVEQD